jgi:hypothetical protein
MDELLEHGVISARRAKDQVCVELWESVKQKFVKLNKEGATKTGANLCGSDFKAG